MKLLYLDVDGVLNDHRPFPNGYNGISSDSRQFLNELLKLEPDLRIVLSSAWRYLVHGGGMTLGGLENLLLTHGIDAHQRLVGVTLSDEDFIPAELTTKVEKRAFLMDQGCTIRAQQILADVLEREPAAWVVLDDLPIPIPNLVQTNGDLGLRAADVLKVRRVLSPPEGASVPVELGRAWR